MIVLLQTILVLLQNPSTLADSNHLNVYGQPLALCSTDGMAATGFTRDGDCAVASGDQFSHHICMDLSSTTFIGHNFCEVTGQPNWCSQQMPCFDSSSALCPIEHWCVCQLAFADYLQQAEGCEAIHTINCEATNIKAVEAYQANAWEHKFYDAYACLASRCGLEEASAVY